MAMKNERFKKWTQTRAPRLKKKPVVTKWVIDIAGGVAKGASKPVKGRLVKR